jgi:hypothetical protein
MSRKVFRYNITNLTLWLFFSLLFFFPFQKRCKIFTSFSRSLIPADLHLPSSFSRHMFYYWTDIIILFLFGFCLYQKRHSLKSFFFGGTAKYLYIFMLISLLSLLNSVTANYALQYFRLLHFSLFALLFCSIQTCLSPLYTRQPLQERNQSRLDTLFKIILCSALLECTIAISQYFLQHSIGLHLIGESSIKHFYFPMKYGHRWIFDSLFDVSRGTDALFRASGTFAHPNVLGCFFFFSTLATYYLFNREEKKKNQLLLQAAIFLQCFALCITYSRAAIIAFLFSSCVWIVLISWKKPVSWAPSKVKRLILTVGLSVLICLGLFYSQFFSRGGIVNYNQIVEHADTERVVYQKVAWEMFKENPLLGVGFNNYKFHVQKFTPITYQNALFAKVHNIYLLILAETGICGLLAFCCFIGSILKETLKGAWNDEKIAFFAIFTGFLFMGGCDFYFLDSQHGEIMFFSVAALLYVTSRKEQSEACHNTGTYERIASQ